MHRLHAPKCLSIFYTWDLVINSATWAVSLATRRTPCLARCTDAETKASSVACCVRVATSFTKHTV
eukprot:4203320-Amphidinium_carterae.1